MKHLLVASCVVAALATLAAPIGAAHAQAIVPSPADAAAAQRVPPPTPTPMPATPAVSLPSSASEGERDEREVEPWVAGALSIGGTIASYATMAIGYQHPSAVIVGGVGAFVMPSVGRWYAHQAAWGGLTLRVLSVGAAVAIASSSFHFCTAEDPCGNRSGDVVLGVLLAGTFVTSTIYDLVKAPSDAAEYNARLKHVALVPMVQPEHHSYGLALAAQF